MERKYVLLLSGAVLQFLVVINVICCKLIMSRGGGTFDERQAKYLDFFPHALRDISLITLVNIFLLAVSIFLYAAADQSRQKIFRFTVRALLAIDAALLLWQITVLI
jgi:hypothetical protein